MKITRAIDLRRVAEWTGRAVDEIQALNPELRRWTTPLRPAEYELKLPVGTAEQFEARMSTAPAAELASLKWHTVRRGETLTSIARKLGVSRTDLAEANHLMVRSRVRIGQALVIPRKPASLLAARTTPAAPTTVASRDIAGPSVMSEEPSAQSRTITYRVKRGDTLFGIARLFDTTVAEIKALNRLRSNLINPGDRLRIVANR